MSKVFVALHARAFCHTTESLERVQLAVQTAVGPTELKLTRAEGHHGNPITVVEAQIEGDGQVDGILRRLDREDLERLISTASSRMDDDCNLFFRLDKQACFKGRVMLSTGEDVISLRLRVRAYPSRKEIALGVLTDHLKGLLA